jgi:hypothetical protein
VAFRAVDVRDCFLPSPRQQPCSGKTRNQTSTKSSTYRQLLSNPGDDCCLISAGCPCMLSLLPDKRWVSVHALSVHALLESFQRWVSAHALPAVGVRARSFPRPLPSAPALVNAASDSAKQSQSAEHARQKRIEQFRARTKTNGPNWGRLLTHRTTEIRSFGCS